MDNVYSDVCYNYYNNGQTSLRGPRPIEQRSTYPFTPRQPRKPIEVRIPRTNPVPQPPSEPYVYPAPTPQLERKPSKTELPLNDFIPPLPASSSSTKTIQHLNSMIRRKPTPPIPAPRGGYPAKPLYKTPLTHYSSDDEDDLNDEDILRDLTLSRKKSVHDITISSDEEDYDDYESVDTTLETSFDLPPIPQTYEANTSTAQYTRKTDLPPIPSISAPGYSDDEQENNCKNKTPLPVIPTICVPGDFSDDEQEQTEQKKKSDLYNSIYCGVRCGGCEEPLSGQAITTTGKHWHPRCFKCQACRQNLEHIAFYEKDGFPYCALDYHELFSPRCDYCKTPIEEHSISALGKTYHAGHFFCRECGKPFDEETNFLEHDGHAYCEADYYKQFGKACKGCEETITGNFLVALSGEWHKECFVCADCGSAFASSTFLIRGGKPYCEAHYNQQATVKKEMSSPKPKPLKPLPAFDLLASNVSKTSIIDKEQKVAVPYKTCHQCCRPITGRCHSAFGHDYHPAHFKCSKCNKLQSPIIAGSYEQDDGNIICIHCARKK